MTKYIPYVFYFWLIAMHQVFLSDITSIFDVKINLIVLIVMLIAIHKSEMTALWTGCLTGMIGFVGSGDMWPWHMLLMGFIGLISFNIKERMNLESLFAKVLLLFCGVLIHNIIVLVLELNEGYILYLFKIALPGAVYTTVIGWVFFLFKDERITFKKIKTIF